MKDLKKEYVILVDENDREVGTMEKMEAHRQGVLHRAFSVFLFNSKGEVLLQQRAIEKYHSPGLWTNTCCSHQRPSENTLQAASRRLMEEMGIEAEMKDAFSFIYKVAFDNDLIEHELDHVVIGEFNGKPNPQAQEVMAWKWMHPDHIRAELEASPENFTEWFKICFEQMHNHYLQNKAS